ncbi:hypothetical protein [Fundidesulfovibrio terrae]|uniref:hypothetical protein n=1 Tax=Fundidesulfovibrio terrae TaxID=2922866 RepID=UPI001FAED714|nr:hypothetical protein [Fundidesulfovibrio terrae]
MRPIPLHVLLLVLLAALALTSPAWCGAGEIRQLTAELDKAKDAIFLPDSSTLRDRTLAQFAERPPGPGWADWSVSDLPSFSLAYDVLELLRAADVLGFLDRRDATARKVLLEMAGRIRDTGREDARWLARTGRWIQASVSIPHAQDMVGHAREKSPEVRRLLARLKAALRAEALAGGPPPKGRPVLAESFPDYAKLVRDSNTLVPLAIKLEREHGAAIPRDWPRRIRITQTWARGRADVLNMISAAKLSEKSPKPALEYAEFFTDEAGWALEGVIHNTWWDDDGYKPFLAWEQPLARKLRSVIDAFFDIYYGPSYDRNAEIRHWLHRE